MGLTYGTVSINAIGASNGAYEAQFLVEPGATDTSVPKSTLHRIGIRPVGKMTYELDDGTLREYPFGPA